MKKLIFSLFLPLFLGSCAPQSVDIHRKEVSIPGGCG